MRNLDGHTPAPAEGLGSFPGRTLADAAPSVPVRRVQEIAACEGRLHHFHGMGRSESQARSFEELHCRQGCLDTLSADHPIGVRSKTDKRARHMSKHRLVSLRTSLGYSDAGHSEIRPVNC